MLQLADVAKWFEVRGRTFPWRPQRRIRAVDGVSLEVRRGETLGLVGESGCGKSTLGRCMLRLQRPSRGTVTFAGRDLARLGRRELRAVRRDLQLVFQDPLSSLNPRRRIGASLAEPLRVHGEPAGPEHIAELLSAVGLEADHAERFPHEFSGGQRQRICIARALALRPKLVVADEPVSALDVSVQAQILNLFQELKERFGLTYVFISHDLGVIRHVSDRVAVMYLGRIVETAPTDELYRQPLHPYTAALLAAVPPPDPILARRRRKTLLVDDVPSPVDLPSGCRFHPRCPLATELCRTVEPRLTGHLPAREVACHHPLGSAG